MKSVWVFGLSFCFSVVTGSLSAQVPAGQLVVTASIGTGVTGGSTTGVYLVDPVSGTATAITGTHASTSGLLVGASGNGANAIMIDDVTGHLIVGTMSNTSIFLPGPSQYYVREITLDSTGLVAVSDVAIATISPPPSTTVNVGIQALAVLPNGDILALESTLAAFSGMTIGLVQYARSTGAPTPWPITGAPSGIGHSLSFDAGANGGAGAAIVGYAPTASSNTIFEVPFGGGPASSIVTYDNAVLTAGGGGIPTGMTLDGSGNLVVSHNNATTGSTRIDRATGTPTTIAVSAFGSGQNALCYDPINDDIITVANVTSATTANAREVRRIDLTTGIGSVIVQIPGGNTNGIDMATGSRVYGQACNVGGGSELIVGVNSAANEGNVGFALRVSNGTPGGPGAIGVGLARAFVNLSGLPCANGAAHNSLDLLILPFAFDGTGNFLLPASLPVGSAGLQAYVQYADTSGALLISAGQSITIIP